MGRKGMARALSVKYSLHYIVNIGNSERVWNFVDKVSDDIRIFGRRGPPENQP